MKHRSTIDRHAARPACQIRDRREASCHPFRAHPARNAPSAKRPRSRPSLCPSLASSVARRARPRPKRVGRAWRPAAPRQSCGAWVARDQRYALSSLNHAHSPVTARRDATPYLLVLCLLLTRPLFGRGLVSFEPVYGKVLAIGSLFVRFPIS